MAQFFQIHCAGDASGFSGMTMRVAPARGPGGNGHPGRGGYLEDHPT